MEKNKSLRIPLTVKVLLAAIIAFSLSSCVVDCNVPDLINAINNANANPAHSTLNLTTDCVYTLTAVDNEVISEFGGSTFDYGDNGLPQITTPITINGNYATIVRDGGAPHFRIFFIKETGSLTLNNITLQNGFADGTYPGGGSGLPGSGGAIYNQKTTLEINDSTLLDHQATFDGGAIFSTGNTTTLINGSTITNNTAPRGGGVLINHGGLLSISDSEISENSASSDGGGVNVSHGAELIVSNSLFDSNSTGRKGGGIFKDVNVDKLPTTITNSTFSENTADWSGGGVFIWRSQLTITGSEFTDNHAEEYGGGIGHQDWYANTNIISDTIFSGNVAGWDGGAIHFSGEQMSVNNCTIQDNTAINGAGIHNGPTTDSRYISRPDTSLTVTGGILQENIASTSGGGVFNAAVMTCGETNFVANEAANLGGGIHNTGNLEVLGCMFEKNTSGDDGGGIHSDQSVEVRSSEFTFNSSGRGGGISVSAGSGLIDNSIFKSNESTGEGGGVYNNGEMHVELCEFASNDAKTLGGGIHNANLIEVLESSFEGNIAAADGGGLNTYKTAYVRGTTFVDNTGFRGGGLASVGGDTTLLNSTISANTATDSGGGIFNMGPLIGDTSSGGAMSASFITVAYNNAPSGGGIATTGGRLDIKSSIIALSASGGDCQSNNVDMKSLDENIDTDDSCPGFTLKEDPLLDVLANYGGPTDTHALKPPDSPAIDAAADCTDVSGGVVTADQRGDPRPAGFYCDLGAYEDPIGAPAPKIQPCTYTAVINVFCRLGPDNSLYPVVDSLEAGESAPVLGQSWDKVFAYVEGPATKLMCAVPATEKFGKLTGDCEDIEIIVPPDVDEDLPEVEQGCTIIDNSGALVCVAPCPDRAKPGDPCTP